MNYAFVRRYNPIYDLFLVKYFKEGGINFDGDIAYSEVAPRWAFASMMKNMSPVENLFCSYVSLWRLHPEARPAYLELFEKAIGGQAYPDIKRFEELESPLVEGQGKLVFSSDEAAKDVAAFYRKFIREPLRMEVDRGAVGKELIKFFSMKEIMILPDTRSVGIETFEMEVHRITGELQSWLDAITYDEVHSDIHVILDEHEKMGEHMKLSPPNPHMNGKVLSCIHESEFFELTCYKHPRNSQQNMMLRPARGFDHSDYILEPGWNYIASPQYYVVNLHKWRM